MKLFDNSNLQLHAEEALARASLTHGWSLGEAVSNFGNVEGCRKRKRNGNRDLLRISKFQVTSAVLVAVK